MGLATSKEVVDYQMYRFGRSQQRFRGPRPDLSQPYISFIGGSDTFGKFAPLPYPQLIEKELDFTCANWGTPGAGPSFFLKDPVVLEACSKSAVCVISVMGAVAMSNRLYSVFKRRNSRVRDVTETLRALYPNLELGDFRFAHNMLRSMHREDPARFRVIDIELRQAWVARMRELLEEIETTRVILWMSTRTPEEDFEASERKSFITHPAFVSREMLDEIEPLADMVVEYVPAEEVARAGFSIHGEATTEEPRLPVPSQAMHYQVAEILVDPLRDAIGANSTTRAVLG